MYTLQRVKIEDNQATTPVVGAPSPTPGSNQRTTDIVACTACSPSPCTHPANNGCAAPQVIYLTVTFSFIL